MRSRPAARLLPQKPPSEGGERRGEGSNSDQGSLEEHSWWLAWWRAINILRPDPNCSGPTLSEVRR